LKKKEKRPRVTPDLIRQSFSVEPSAFSVYIKWPDHFHLWLLLLVIQLSTWFVDLKRSRHMKAVCN